MSTQQSTIRFQTNVPEVVALAFSDGLDVEGRYGDQVLYTLADDRKMYVPPIVRSKILELGIDKQEQFTICKREIVDGRRRRIEWQVGKGADIGAENGSAPAKAAKPTEAPVQSKGSEPQTQSTPPPRPPVNGSAAATGAAGDAPRPKTKLEDALKTVIYSISSAQAFAKEIGFQIPPFTSEDISKMAMTLTIEGRNGGQR